MPSIKHHLKQHFIPHEGNNYHPHALHTKRAIFYSGFFIALKVFVVAFAVMLPTEAFLAPDVLAEQNQKIISLTNALRKEQGLPVYDVNAALERSASLKAEDMNTQQYFSHTSPDGHGLSYFLSRVGYHYRFAGENLAVGFSDANDVVNAWIKSPKHYSNLIDKDFQQFGIGLVAGEYEGQPTVFVAQHFGTPAAVTEPTAVVKATQPAAGSGKQQAKPVASSTPQQVAQKPVEKPIVKPAVIAPAPKPTVASSTPVIVPTTRQLDNSTTPVETIALDTTKTQAATSSELALNDSSTSSSILGTTEQQIPSDSRLSTSDSSVSWVDFGKNHTALTAEVRLSSEAKSVTVTAGGYSIPLVKSNDGVYRGTLTASVSSKELFRVIIPPTVDVVFQDGTTLREAISWKNPKIASQTPWERYVQANSWLYGSIAVFPVVRGIYWFALIFFLVALGLSIFIEIKKQHPHIIAQTVGVIGVIALMLWK